MRVLMQNKVFFWVIQVLLLGMMTVFGWQLHSNFTGENLPDAQRVNLALRRTAHHLLAAAGDTTSRIPPVARRGVGVWSIRLEQDFIYDSVPTALQTALAINAVKKPYSVSIWNCDTAQMVLGYTSFDLKNPKDISCLGRSLENTCYDLQVTFQPRPDYQRVPRTGWLVLLTGLLAAATYGLRPKPTPEEPEPVASAPETGLPFGHSRLDLPNLTLFSTGETHPLTYREAKLLSLFVQHPNQVLERAYILDQVWADEGVIVGRSVDVFVSRLRKMLKSDPSVALVAVHGVGYRLEVKG